MSSWLNSVSGYATAVLDSVDNLAKDQLADGAGSAGETAAERRRTKRQQEADQLQQETNILKADGTGAVDSLLPVKSGKELPVGNEVAAQPAAHQPESPPLHHPVESQQEKGPVGVTLVEGEREKRGHESQQSKSSSRMDQDQQLIATKEENTKTAPSGSGTGSSVEDVSPPPPPVPALHTSPPQHPPAAFPHPVLPSAPTSLPGVRALGKVAEVVTGAGAGGVTGGAAETKRLKREVEELSLELEALEDKLMWESKELRQAAEALSKEKQRAAEREAVLHGELLQMQHLAKSEEARLLEANSVRDAALMEAERQRAAALEEGARAKQLFQELEALESTGTSSVAHMRKELAAAAEASEAMALEQDHQLRLSQERQAVLEAANADLGRNVADLQKKLEQARAQAAAVTQPEILSLRSQLDAAHAEAADADARLQHMRVELDAALKREAEADQARGRERVLEQELQAMQLKLRESEQQRAEAQAEARAARMTHTGSGSGASKAARTATPPPGASELQERLDRMTQRLLEKQKLLEQANCTAAALSARLQDVEQRARDAERDAGGFVSDLDMESGRIGVRRRPRQTKPVRLPPVLARREGLAHAVGSVDRWALLAGGYLRAEPLARVMAVLYLAVLHIWAFAVLAFHSQSLEELHPDTGGGPGVFPAAVGPNV